MHNHVFDLAGTCSGPGPCDVKPFGAGKSWVNKVGGLPLYIRAIAHALQRGGKSESAAIATAVATVKRWALGGGDVSAATRARAAKAVAEWEAKKAASHALSATSEGVDLAARWKHGWIPLNAEAVEQRKKWAKNGGGPKGAKGFTHTASPHATGEFKKYPKAGDVPKADPLLPQKNEHGVPTFLVHGGPDHGKRITRSQAAEQMFGTGSKQHMKAAEMDRQAAIKHAKAKNKKKAPAKKKPAVKVPATDPMAARRRREAQMLRERPSSRARFGGGSVPLSAPEGTPLDMASCPHCHTTLTVDLAPGEPPGQTKTSPAQRQQIRARRSTGEPPNQTQTQGGSGFNSAVHPRAGAGSPTGGQFITAGSSGDQAAGVEDAIGTKVDGKIDNADVAAIKAFQKANGLQVDGIIGTQTADQIREGDVRKGGNRTRVKPGALLDVDRQLLAENGAHARGAKLSAPGHGVDLAARTDLLRRAVAAHHAGTLTPEGQRALKTYLGRIRNAKG